MPSPKTAAHASQSIGNPRQATIPGEQIHRIAQFDDYLPSAIMILHAHTTPYRGAKRNTAIRQATKWPFPNAFNQIATPSRSQK